jgi:hypothetical protein
MTEETDLDEAMAGFGAELAGYADEYGTEGLEAFLADFEAMDDPSEEDRLAARVAEAVLEERESADEG